MNFMDWFKWGNSSPDMSIAQNPELMKMSNYSSTGNSSGSSGLLGNLWGSMFDKTDAAGIKSQGWLAPTMGVAQGIGNAYMGMRQYGLAEDALKEQQRQFNVNFEAQRKMTNSMLEDRQRSRVAANPGAYQSVGDYMQKYGV